MIESMYRKYGIRFKPRTMQRILRRLGFSYRKSGPAPVKSPSREVLDKFMRETNKEIILPSIRDGYPILAADASACERYTEGGYAWRPKGGDDTVPISYTKQSVKMFGALGEDGYHIKTVDALNSTTFIEFLKELLEIYGRFVILLDNALCHKSKMVGEFIRSTGGAIVPVFLPPHSPQLNPIEIQWRELKRLLSGRCFKSLEDLNAAIEGIAAG